MPTVQQTSRTTINKMRCIHCRCRSTPTLLWEVRPIGIVVENNRWPLRNVGKLIRPEYAARPLLAHEDY